MATAYEYLPVPGFTSPTSEYTSPEIMYSMKGFTQKGVTLGGGQGVLLAGTVLAQQTSDKKYYAYDNAGTGGLETARGILRRGADTGTVAAPVPQLGNIVILGIIKLGSVIGLDAAALVELGATQDTVRGTLKL